MSSIVRWLLQQIFIGYRLSAHQTKLTRKSLVTSQVHSHGIECCYSQNQSQSLLTLFQCLWLFPVTTIKWYIHLSSGLKKVQFWKFGKVAVLFSFPWMVWHWAEPHTCLFLCLNSNVLQSLGFSNAQWIFDDLLAIIHAFKNSFNKHTLNA